MRTLTFGDDGSLGASVAWGWVTAQKWPDWEIDVVTVTHPDRAASDSDQRLHEWIPSTPRVAPKECECSGIRFLTAAGDPRRILCEVPDSELIVVGPRGHGALSWLHIGSTTQGLLHHPEKAVVIARSAAPVRRLLVCIDGSDNADRAARFAAGLPWMSGTYVTVISVVDGTVDLRGRVTAVETVFAEAGAVTEALIVEPNPLVLTVNVRDALFEAVSDLQPDLVVLGARGMSTFERIAIGSIADAVAQHVSCSVLLVR